MKEVDRDYHSIQNALRAVGIPTCYKCRKRRKILCPYCKRRRLVCRFHTSPREGKSSSEHRITCRNCPLFSTLSAKQKREINPKWWERQKKAIYAWRKDHRVQSNRTVRDSVVKARMFILNYYGGKCLPETIPHVKMIVPCPTPSSPRLEIAHKYGDGDEHRAAMWGGGRSGGGQIVWFVKKCIELGPQKDPTGRVWTVDDFTILCRGCNAKQMGLEMQQAKSLCKTEALCQS